MRKKIKSLTTVIIVLAIIAAVLGGALVYVKMSLTQEQAVSDAYAKEMTENQKSVYTAMGDIKHGDTLTEGKNVQLQNVYTGLPTTVYISKKDLGSTAIVDIPKGVTVMKEMVTPISIAEDTREYEIQVARLMQDQKENDYVDIRIMFPDGRDQLVLAKKQIKNMDKENCVFWSYLNEEEILRLASATIDAYTITGTQIYADRYVESNLQDEAQPTYLVNTTVLDMFDSSSASYDGNLLTKAIQTLNSEARLQMEDQLNMLTPDKLAAVAAGHGLEDTAKNSALTGAGEYNGQEAEAAAESTGSQSETDSTEESTEETTAESSADADTVVESTTAAKQ